MRSRGEGLKDGRGSRGARGECQGVLRMLESGDCCFEIVPSAIMSAGQLGKGLGMFPPVWIRAPHIFIGADGLADAGLRKCGRQRYLYLSFPKVPFSCTGMLTASMTAPVEGSCGDPA